MALFPSHALEKDKFPPWKIQFIEHNREWFDEISPWLSSRWVRKLWTFPPSLRKLEWNCQGEERDLWQHCSREC